MRAALVALCTLLAVSGRASALGPGHAEAVVKDFYRLQSKLECRAWGDLLSPHGFQIIDPFGSPPTTDLAQAVAGCESAPKTFSSVRLAATHVAVLADQSAAAANFHVGSVTTANCTLDFDGIDTFEFDAAGYIKGVVGYFNATIPGGQFNCRGSQ
jgi:hypothetical protein